MFTSNFHIVLYSLFAVAAAFATVQVTKIILDRSYFHTRSMRVSFAATIVTILVLAGAFGYLGLFVARGF
jgi:hypothetical protein